MADMAPMDWMGKIKHDGSLHRMLGVDPSKKIPIHKLMKALHSKNMTLKKKAVSANNMRNANK